MTWYSVGLHGKGCRITVVDRRWGVLRRPTTYSGGFYTTRWVEASSPDEAGESARAMVEAELRELQQQGWLANGPDEPWTVAVQETREDHSESPDANKGFTWYASRA